MSFPPSLYLVMARGRPYITGAEPTAYIILQTAREAARASATATRLSPRRLLLSNRLLIQATLSLSMSLSVTSHRLPKTKGEPRMRYCNATPVGSCTPCNARRPLEQPHSIAAGQWLFLSLWLSHTFSPAPWPQKMKSWLLSCVAPSLRTQRGQLLHHTSQSYCLANGSRNADMVARVCGRLLSGSTAYQLRDSDTRESRTSRS